MSAGSQRPPSMNASIAFSGMRPAFASAETIRPVPWNRISLSYLRECEPRQATGGPFPRLSAWNRTDLWICPVPGQ
jgi:hypothetical protein